MSTLDFISTTALVMHLDEAGHTIQKTRLERHFRHHMPQDDFPLVATVRDNATGATTEFRVHQGVVYRNVPERDREASGGLVYLRLPEAQARDLVEHAPVGVLSATFETLAYQSRLWVRSQMPTYRVRQTGHAVVVSAGWSEGETIEFNGLQLSDAVECALQLGTEAGLSMLQTHQITLANKAAAGPAGATTSASATTNTVKQQIGAIQEAVAGLAGEHDAWQVLEQVENLVRLAAGLGADVRKTMDLAA